MTNIDPALMQKIFYIPQRQREPHVHHDGQANDFRGGLKVAKGVLIFHAPDGNRVDYARKAVFF
jgi:hypothetical protein